MLTYSSLMAVGLVGVSSFLACVVFLLGDRTQNSNLASKAQRFNISSKCKKTDDSTKNEK